MELRILLNILYRRRVILLFVFGLFLLLVGLITFLAPESYEATAKITIEKTDKMSTVMKGLGLEDVVLDTRVDDDVSLDTDIELLMIRPLMNQLIMDMNLRDTDGEYFDTDDFIDGGFKSKIKGTPSVTIKQYNETALVNIAATSTIPDQAAEIANRLARMYKDERISRTREDFREIKNKINISLSDIREKYYSILQTQKDFMLENSIVNLDSTITSLLGQIVSLENSRVEYHRDIEVLHKTIAASRSKLEKEEKMWESSSEVGQNSLVTELKQKSADLAAELAGLQITMTEKHPDHRSIVAQIDTITALIKKEPSLSTNKRQFTINPVYESLYQKISDNMVDLKGMLGKLETLETQLTEYRKRLLKLPVLQVKHSKLETEISVNSKIYAALLKYSIEIGLAESAAVAKIRIVEPATVPKQDNPAFPRSSVNMVLGIILGSFFAIGAALTVDYADGTVRESETLRTLSEKTHFGSLPYTPSLVMRPQLIFRSSANFTEQLRWIRDAVLFETENKHNKGKIFVVTSVSERAGASTVSAGFSRMLAERYGSTLLVDLNFRSPSVASLLKQRFHGTGSANVLHNNGMMTDDCLQDSPVEGLSVLVSGSSSDRTEQLLDSPALSSLFTTLRQQFRYIVVDTPSLAFYYDATLIAREADTVILVVKAADATEKTVTRSLERLRIIGDRPIGTVMNYEGYTQSVLTLPCSAIIFMSELLRQGKRKSKRS
ncbi:MAG: polysaccharide biosynthesis tyrosine autokinase [Candidatus Electrothrix sp. Rat3]|nr:polysaccharide biosynthesis tyrosine autokinase [Candidatus Electrothrix rattekaaiensis]